MRDAIDRDPTLDVDAPGDSLLAGKGRMSLAKYSFVPWVRRGIANQLETPAGAASRAALSVTIRVRSNTAGLDLAPKSVLLIGPGDIIGINHQMVVRTEPRAGIANFESNYLAYVDFYDEDFAWRYTPDIPDAALHRLKPWLTLLVLRKTNSCARQAAAPRDRAQAGHGCEPEEHPSAEKDELWAWAHVHLNTPLGADGAPNLDVLGAVLRENPDLGYSRLMSLRRLEANTTYHAFVIPTFEAGRLAGLGDPVPDSTPGLDLAWTAGRMFPAYYSWEFSTGPAGDFEDLVKALVPRDIDKRVGIRQMDVQQPGFYSRAHHRTTQQRRRSRRRAPGADDGARAGACRRATFRRIWRRRSICPPSRRTRAWRRRRSADQRAALWRGGTRSSIACGRFPNIRTGSTS